MASLEGQRVLIISGGSGIGLATARTIQSAGAQVTIAGRNRARLEQAAATIGDVEIATVDLLDGASIEALFKSTGSLDRLVLPGSDTKFGGIRDLSVEVAHQDVADVVLMLLTNPNMTGAVVDVDAGALLV